MTILDLRVFFSLAKKVFIIFPIYFQNCYTSGTIIVGNKGWS